MYFAVCEQQLGHLCFLCRVLKKWRQVNPSDSVPMERVNSQFQVFHEHKNTAFLLDEGGYNGVFPFQDAPS